MRGEWADDGTPFQQALRLFPLPTMSIAARRKAVSETGAPGADSFYRFGIAAVCRTTPHCSYKIAEENVRPMSVIVKLVFAWGVKFKLLF